ncbi:hypothetical protein [Streptomyces sp. NBC_00076]|uniref:hypothetical protein n=1 Tax=Streptomyces sp. NBC_00076 TaxID=2975642 RepID=UPI003246C331
MAPPRLRTFISGLVLVLLAVGLTALTPGPGGGRRLRGRWAGSTARLLQLVLVRAADQSPAGRHSPDRLGEGPDGQGMDPAATGDYSQLPWRLALLTQTNSSC